MLTYSLSNRGGMSRYLYLYTCIKEDISRGVLAPGERLPSKRALAEHLGVSVLTVEYAYRLLEDEGYVTARQRSGYFVCRLDGTLSPARVQTPAEEASEQSAHVPGDYPI